MRLPIGRSTQRQYGGRGISAEATERFALLGAFDFFGLIARTCIRTALTIFTHRNPRVPRKKNASVRHGWQVTTKHLIRCGQIRAGTAKLKPTRLRMV
jgi:hypothetical protein